MEPYTHAVAMPCVMVLKNKPLLAAEAATTLPPCATAACFFHFQMLCMILFVPNLPLFHFVFLLLLPLCCCCCCCASRVQAVLPLRGKILNVERKDDAAMLKNQEISNLIVALGLGAKVGARPGSGGVWWHVWGGVR